MTSWRRSDRGRARASRPRHGRRRVRRTLHHEHGQLRNGTTGEVAGVDPTSGRLDLRLADGSELRLQPDEIAQADLRLAYVQHPFPAQGHTTDTAHLIIAGAVTREGSYVALTRARDQTHIYAADAPDRSDGADRLQDLADRISRTEPELPSIHTPLAHETTILATQEAGEVEPGVERADQAFDPTPQAEPRPPERQPVTEIMGRDAADAQANTHGAEDDDQASRVCPRRAARDLAAPPRGLEELERDQSSGWEP